MASEPGGWLPPPPAEAPALAWGEAHVWRAPLDLTPAILDRLASTLSDDERERARRFAFAGLAARFVAARGIQRQLLARYLDVPPAAIRYRVTPHGKPELADALCGTSDLRFNASNSGGLALFALVRGRDVGVDLEEVKPLPDAMEIASRFFSTRERAAMRALPREEVHRAFYRCWTRKEAYVKTVGEGLSIPLDRFDVSFGPGEQPRLLAVRNASEGAAEWSLHGLEPGEGYTGALVARGALRVVRCFAWDGAESGPVPGSRT